MPDPNLPLLEDAARKLAAFLEEIVFVDGVTLGPRIGFSLSNESAMQHNFELQRN